MCAAEERPSSVSQPSSRQKIKYSSGRPTNRDHARSTAARKPAGHSLYGSKDTLQGRVVIEATYGLA